MVVFDEGVAVLLACLWHLGVYFLKLLRLLLVVRSRFRVDL